MATVIILIEELEKKHNKQNLKTMRGTKVIDCNQNWKMALVIKKERGGKKKWQLTEKQVPTNQEF